VTDPDILAIQRKRRQQGRCLQCGKKAPRAMLCRTCREHWRYCPACEAVYDVDAAIPGRTVRYCRPCDTLRTRKRRDMVSWQEYTTGVRAKSDARLTRIIARYRAGQSYDTIASALGITKGQLSGIINHAKQTGRWPAKLKRYKKEAA